MYITKLYKPIIFIIVYFMKLYNLVLENILCYNI